MELGKKVGGWIAQLQEDLLDYVLTNYDRDNPGINILSNLTIVSLNYDRVFEHIISHNFFIKAIEHSKYNLTSAGVAKTFSLANSLTVLKPHGCLSTLAGQNHASRVGMNLDLELSNTFSRGTRYPGVHSNISYGDQKIISKGAFLKMGRYMYVVDERGLDDYRSSNDALTNAEIVICFGLSTAGICQNLLDFGKVKRIYLSNKTSDIAEISMLKPGPEYISLSNSPNRLEAKDFPEKFAQLCL